MIFRPCAGLSQSGCNPPDLEIEGLPESVCILDQPYSLNGIPTGGQFYINGLSANQLNPEQLGSGSHVVTYLYVYETGCPPVNLSRIIEVLPLPNLIPVHDTLTCYSPEVTLEVLSENPDISLTWMGPNGFISDETSPIVDQAGVYFAVAGTGECSDTAIVEILENMASPRGITANGGNLNCQTANLQLSLDSSYSDYSYLWNGPMGFSSNEPEPIVQDTGNYIVNIIDLRNGCDTSLSVEVLPPVDVPEITIIQQGALTCVQDSISLSGLTESEDLEFEWKNENVIIGNHRQIWVTVPGQYILTAISPSGCETSTAIMVDANWEPPEINIFTQQESVISCFNPQVVLSYQSDVQSHLLEAWWLNRNGSRISSEEQLTVAEAGQYFLIGSRTDNGCIDTTVFQIAADTVTPVAVASMIHPLDCETLLAVLSGDGSSMGEEYSYSWQSNNDGQIFSSDSIITVVDQTGSYILEVTDETNGCSADAEVTVLEEEFNPEGLNIDVLGPSCNDDLGSIEIHHSGPEVYLFSLEREIFSSQASFSSLFSGNYLLRIQNSKGCEFDTILSVPTLSDFEVMLQDEAKINLGSSILISPEFNLPPNISVQSIRWYKLDSLICDNCTEIEVNPEETTRYRVLAEATNGCIAEDEILIIVGNKRRIYLPNAFSPNQDGVNDFFILREEVISASSIPSRFLTDGEALYLMQALSLPMLKPLDGMAV